MHREVIQEIREAYSPENNITLTLDGFSSSIKTLAEDLYAKNTHFIFELIQNAEDNAYETNNPLLRFVLTKADSVVGNKDSIVLIVENNETGFQKEHVEAICSVGRSTKQKDQGYIGEKGIGFKSVFRVTSCPYIFSNGFHFSLPEKDDLSGLGYIVPTWIQSLPKDLDNNITLIFLPLDKTDFPVDKVTQSLKDIAPETIIFLKTLKTIELSVRLEKQYEIIIEKDDSEFPLVKLTYLKKDDKKEIFTEQLFWVTSKEFDKPDNIHHEKRENIKTREVSIAIPLEGKQKGKLFAYLPVWENTGLPYLINADFLLVSSREGVKEDEPWNVWLRDCISEVYVETLISCLSSDLIPFEKKIKSYASLPRSTNHTFLQPVTQAIQEKLENTDCIYTAHCDVLSIPKTTRIAPKDFWKLLGEDELPRVFRKTKQLVCPELNLYSKDLRTIGSSSLKNEDLLECFDDEHWIASKPNDWLIQLYRYLRKYKVKDAILSTKKIVRVWSDKNQASILSCDEQQPIYFMRDDESRKAIKDVPEWLQKIVPTVFLDQNFLVFLSNQEDAVELMEWMTGHLNIYHFSIANYCLDILNFLLEKYESLSPKRITEATSFLVVHADDEFDWDTIPVVLNNGKKNILSDYDKTIVVPERYDRSTGWQHIWVNEQDQQHFVVLSNHYNATTVDYFLSHCGYKIKKYPNPERVKKIYLAAANTYEKGCIRNCRYRSTYQKSISNWRPPSTLRSETIENEKASDSLLVFLSSNRVESFESATVHYFYYSGRTSRVDSEFYSRIKNCRWLPTQKGFVRPAQSFLPKKEIKEILGETVPYFQGSLPDNTIDSLGIKAKLSMDELLEILIAYSSETKVNPEMIYRVYSTLDTRTRFGNPEDILSLFKKHELIFVPERKKEGQWCALEQVIWEDSEKVLGDDFIYLQKHYPELKNFFISTLGVKEKADPESFAQRWLKLQSDTKKSPQKLREIMEPIYRALLSIAKKEKDERTNWWNDFADEALILTQNDFFVDPTEVVVPDDGELKKIFSSTDVKFVWRPEKDSFSQWAPFYEAFSIPRISESVTSKLIEDADFDIKQCNEFITKSTIIMLSAWIREKDTKYYNKLLDNGMFRKLCNLREATTSAEIEILFTLEAEYLYEEVEENYPVFWNLKDNVLIISRKANHSDIKRKLSVEIAKGLMSNRGYKDLAHWIELILGAGNTERIKDEGWPIPREIIKLFKKDDPPAPDKTSKNETETNQEDKESQPSENTNNSSPQDIENKEIEHSQDDKSGEKTSSAITEKKQDKGPAAIKEERGGSEQLTSDAAHNEETQSIESRHDDQEVTEEPKQDDDILEMFKKAFNRNGETSLSEECEDEDYYNEGTVKNPSRRREKSRTAHKDRITSEPTQDKRRRETIRTILEPADPATRAYLLNLYAGKCQICGRTFPQRNGSSFFVVGHIVERKHARLLDNHANAICLCPLHFAQWRHGAVEAEDIMEQILSKKTKSEGAVDDLSLKIVLCGNKCEISYKEKHIVDLQALLGALDNTEK